MQLIASFFVSPLFATFLLGMFWRRTNKTGAFYGMIAGIAGSIGHYLAYRAGLLHYPTAMAPNFCGAICGWSASIIVTITLSLLTPPPPQESLAGLVYADRIPAAPMPRWYGRPVFQGAGILVAVAVLNWTFF